MVSHSFDGESVPSETTTVSRFLLKARVGQFGPKYLGQLPPEWVGQFTPKYSPLLGEGVCGYFIDPDGNTSTWSYQQGSILVNQAEQTKVESAYKVREEKLKVAVLTDQATASSGEAVAIAFKGRPDARSFGRATCGLSTANVTNRLSDGGLLNLAQSTMADRTKMTYGSSVQVDEVASAETVVSRAVSWLLQ